ncbi:hypothetical protein [Deinococcus frigens]|uniref:hypothetical protein n=1 Tax=Deinococcus frigens TaxID=249403 RepID=UPI0012ECB896|nr:hypothetical protein [Deinococcus frigens]
MSRAAQVVLDAVRGRGSLSVVQARVLLGADPQGALSELCAALLVVHDQGGGPERGRRAGLFRAAPCGRVPQPEDLARARQVLGGQVWTLGTAARVLGWEVADTLEAVRALISAGEAIGSVVGATVVVRVLGWG